MPFIGGFDLLLYFLMFWIVHYAQDKWQVGTGGRYCNRTATEPYFMMHHSAFHILLSLSSFNKNTFYSVPTRHLRLS